MAESRDTPTWMADALGAGIRDAAAYLGEGDPTSRRRNDDLRALCAEMMVLRSDLLAMAGQAGRGSAADGKRDGSDAREPKGRSEVIEVMQSALASAIEHGRNRAEASGGFPDLLEDLLMRVPML